MSANGWKDCCVGDIAAPMKNALVGGPFGSNLVSNDYVQTGVPVIRGQNMGFGRWVGGDFAFVSDDKAKELAANTAKPGDLIFTQRGTLGQIAIVPPQPHDRYIISQSQMKLTVDPAKADAKFVYYLFSSKEQQDYIRRNAIQTGVPHTNLGHLRTTPLRLPPLLEQQSIAQMLAALDDKIELNGQMNETLEATAQTIFQTRFVGASRTGIPLGWEKHGLDEIAHFLNGLALQKFPPQGEDSLPVIKIAQLRAGHTEGADRCGTNLPPQYVVEDGDVLFSWSGSLEVEIWCGGRGALNQHLFKVTSAYFPK